MSDEEAAPAEALASVAPAGAECARCLCPVEADDLRCAVCGLAQGAAPDTARVAVKILRCTGCGAAVAYDVATGAPRCTFCDSVMAIEEPRDPVEHAEWLVPFRVTQDEARAAVGAWLKTRGFFCPSDLASEARLESLRPLAWAAWVFEAHARVSWALDSDAGSQSSSWAPHAGQLGLWFENIVVPATRGLSQQECRSLGADFDLSSAKALPCEHDGVQIEEFEAQRSAARKIIADAVLATAAQRVQQHAPGSTFRKVKTAVVLRSLKTRRIALPTYVMAYRYRGELHRVLVHGQDARGVTGTTPTSLAKVLLVVGIVLAAVMAIAVAAGA